MASRAVAGYQWQGVAMLRATTGPGLADIPVPSTWTTWPSPADG
ncbi:hypothetical protein NKH18_07390 [Streptomyces sp. M10(2022)]